MPHKLVALVQEDVSHLPRHTRLERLVEMAKGLREFGVIDDAAATFFIAKAILTITEYRHTKQSAPAFTRISKRIQELLRNHGLADGEFWPPTEVPDEYRRLNAEHDRLIDALIAATFEEFGEPDLAAMFRYDRGQFDRLYERGLLLPLQS